MADDPRRPGRMRLTAAPLGLLGAFALKVLGKNPDGFGDTVSPVVDVYDQYLQTTENRTIGAIGIGARTVSMTHTLPDRFCWRVLAIGVNFTLDAADIALTATVITSVTSPAVAGTIIEPCGTMVVNGATGTNRALGHLLPRPLLLLPGNSIITRVYLSANVTVALNVNSCLLVQPLEL